MDAQKTKVRIDARSNRLPDAGTLHSVALNRFHCFDNRGWMIAKL
jgi:hypothetical protein